MFVSKFGNARSDDGTDFPQTTQRKRRRKFQIHIRIREHRVDDALDASTFDELDGASARRIVRGDVRDAVQNDGVVIHIAYSFETIEHEPKTFVDEIDSIVVILLLGFFVEDDAREKPRHVKSQVEIRRRSQEIAALDDHSLVGAYSIAIVGAHRREFGEEKR